VRTQCTNASNSIGPVFFGKEIKFDFERTPERPEKWKSGNKQPEHDENARYKAQRDRPVFYNC